MTAASRLPAVDQAVLRRIESMCVVLRAYLVGVKQSLDEEIRTYPTPIRVAMPSSTICTSSAHALPRS